VIARGVRCRVLTFHEIFCQKNTRALSFPDEIIIGKVAPLAPEKIRSWLSQEKKQWRALLFLFSESNDEDEETIERAPRRQVSFWKRHEDERRQAMVRQSDAAQRRARSSAKNLPGNRSAPHCLVAETFRTIKRAAKRHALSVSNVDAQLLHQSSRQESSQETTAHFGKGERRAAQRFRPHLNARAVCSAADHRDCCFASFRCDGLCTSR
jgi:hypothetical protein